MSLLPNYTKHGKILTPITDADFKKIMDHGKFAKPIHRPYVILIYYTGVRKTEALRCTRESFRTANKELIFSVGIRLKHGIETPHLNLPFHYPYIPELIRHIQKTPKEAKLFNFSDMTAYNVFDRLGMYPHYFRLNRITSLFRDGWDIVALHSWTGLTLKALDYYIGLIKVEKMGRSLVKDEEGSQSINRFYRNVLWYRRL